jgi:adenylate kinase family enzyme
MPSKVTVVLRNPVDHQDQLSYTITANDTRLGADWILALKALLESGKPIEKNFCFMGFPNTARTLEYLCREMNSSILRINSNLNYYIQENFTTSNVLARDWADNGPNHELFNRIHNHFERLQGTVENLSEYYLQADHVTKHSIRQINNLCHEMETLILSQRQAATVPEWVRPSQITTWLTADRYNLTAEHREGFITNGYDRVFGGVYMHWTQIGKTLFEVFRDEGAPRLTAATCEAITHLQYYSGEFDVEWGNSITADDVKVQWHTQQLEEFKLWLRANGLDPKDPELSLGYLPLGQVDLQASFGTTKFEDIWPLIGQHLDIYCIQVDNVKQTYDYCWTDADYAHQQIQQLQPGYDHAK